MTRAAVPGLRSRHPIGAHLPALYAEDDLAQRFTAGLDTVLAPVFATLDNLSAYFDPRVTPADFLGWLASWIGAVDDPRWPPDLRREAILRALELHRARGTRRGLTEALRLLLGVGSDVVGDGTAVWSRTALSALPPPPAADLVVRVWPEQATDVDPERVEELVRALCPVHTRCQVRVLAGPPADRGGPA
ncbi:phage tail protein [Streptomyces sp. NPDC057702]|uniref:phage tail protein n=1 Tax=unclassified Streptomyces TaxID=2593676 RepID=UPI003688D9CD